VKTTANSKRPLFLGTAPPLYDRLQAHVTIYAVMVFLGGDSVSITFPEMPIEIKRIFIPSRRSLTTVPGFPSTKKLLPCNQFKNFLLQTVVKLLSEFSGQHMNSA
jgi:hypothetical protein